MYNFFQYRLQLQNISIDDCRTCCVSDLTDLSIELSINRPVDESINWLMNDRSIDLNRLIDWLIVWFIYLIQSSK